MDISRVKFNLNKKVRLKLERHFVDTEYILTGCILRKNPDNNKLFYQAELKDLNAKSVIIASLEDVSEI